MPSSIVPHRTDSEDEDSFLQITMGDIGNATVHLDSFCRTEKNEKAPSSTKREVLGYGSGNFTGSSLHGHQPLTRRPLDR